MNEYTIKYLGGYFVYESRNPLLSFDLFTVFIFITPNILVNIIKKPGNLSSGESVCQYFAVYIFHTSFDLYM